MAAATLEWRRPAPPSAVAVAQLVESRIVIPVVVGSSPISHPTAQNALHDSKHFARRGCADLCPGFFATSACAHERATRLAQQLAERRYVDVIGLTGYRPLVSG